MSEDDPQRSFGRQAKGCEIGPYDGFPSETAFPNSFSVVRFSKWTARNFKRSFFFRSKRRVHVRQNEVFRARAFGQRTQIERITLTKIGMGEEPAAFVR